MDETDFPEDLAVRVRNVGKTYRLGVISRRTLRDELVYRWLRLRGRDPKSKLGRIGGRELADPGLFHALDDVSFDIRKGETVGLIGRNGAGKSTMLKILARITTPTTGEAWIRGRVGSMLEVGTGFHPELTGRENIYLNGTILGMTKKEIDAKFDEIVEFSEIGDFLDTPVKRYSSGMYVKLAFSIASSLDNDVLLLDEVLAVGDAAFRKKSLARMKEIAASGRTILFVSHSMGDIKTICSRCIWFENGSIAMEGGTDEVAQAYERLDVFSSARSSKAQVASPHDKTAEPTTGVDDLRFPARVDSLRLSYEERVRGWRLEFHYSFENDAPWESPRAGVAIRDPQRTGRPVAVFDSAVVRGLPRQCPSTGVLAIDIPPELSFSLDTVAFDVRLWAAGTIVFDGSDIQFATIPPNRFSPDGWLRTPFRDSEIRCMHGWSLVSGQERPDLAVREDRLGSGSVRIKQVKPFFDSARGGWSFFLSYRTADGASWANPRIALAIRTSGISGKIVSVFDTRACPDIPSFLPGVGTAELVLPDGCSFASGSYTVDFRVWVGKGPADDIVDACTFEIDDNSASPGWIPHPPYKVGIANLRHRWRFFPRGEEEQ